MPKFAISCCDCNNTKLHDLGGHPTPFLLSYIIIVVPFQSKWRRSHEYSHTKLHMNYLLQCIASKINGTHFASQFSSFR